ncbi:reverse transcriptase domain-containing protein [Tanacetum coccineum]
MFNSTLIGSARLWFDKLLPESINSYIELRKAFLANFLQQKKYIKDLVEIHHIKKREGESTEAFMKCFKAESMHVKRAPEYMRVSRFMHGITNLDLIKQLNDNIPKSMDEMMSVTMSFLRREVVVANQSRKKGPPSWWHHKAVHKPSFKKNSDFKNRQRSNKRHDRFTPLIKTPKEILAMDAVKFKAPPPMSIEEAVKSGQLSHLIMELKQGNNKGEHLKVVKKGETSGKEKALAIFMMKPWQRVTSQKVTRSFSTNLEISFPLLENDDGQEGLIVIEVEIRGHLIYRMCMDGDFSQQSINGFMVKDTSSSSIDYIPKSPTSLTSPSPNGYLNPSTSPPPRVSPPPPTQDNASMDITLTLSPNTPLDVQFDTPSPSPPIIAHPIPWNFLEAHDFYSQVTVQTDEYGYLVISFMIQHEFITLTLAQFGQILKILYNGQAVFTNEWDLVSLEYSQETEGPYSTDLPTPDDIRRLLELERVMVDRTIKSQTVTLTPN